MSDGLKPCPFCGGPAIYEELAGEYENVVRCKDDKCAGTYGVWGDFLEDPKTIPLWNTRAETYTRADVEAAVKRALEGAANCLLMFSEPGVALDYSLKDEIEAIRSLASDPAQFIDGEK